MKLFLALYQIRLNKLTVLQMEPLELSKGVVELTLSSYWLMLACPVAGKIL